MTSHLDSTVSELEAMDTTSPPPPSPPDRRHSEHNSRDRTNSCSKIESSSVLLDEFNNWKKKAPKKLSLKEVKHDQDDGKTSLRFSLDHSGQTFLLHCPLHYPAYSIDEDNFFVEADSGLQLWCNALNEFVLDSDGRLALSAILNKGLSLYSSADEEAAHTENNLGAVGGEVGFNNHRGADTRSKLSSDDDEDYDEDDDDMDMYEEGDMGHGDDEQLEDILDNDLTWELEIARRKKRWRQKEDELRAEKMRNSETGVTEEDRSLQQLYHDPSIKNRQPKQVFTHAGASGILINDLVQIMETADKTGINVDTIDDNIFQWNVRIRNFANSNLEKDLKELERLYGYDYIELQLDFSMDLYPFFPPLVKVIRPRLQGSMMLRVTTMEILKLSYWNPARDMKSVLIDIKSFLQTWARLELSSERNDKSRYAEGAYIDIEHHLLRLALVSEIVPRANKKYAVTNPPPRTILPTTAFETTIASTSKHQAAATVVTTATSTSTESKASSSPSTDKKKPEEKKALKSKFSIFGLSKDSSGAGSSKDSKESKEKKKAALAKNMAKGVGYSNCHQKGWDIKAYVAAQREKDKQIELVLGKIYQELKKLHGQGGTQAGSKNLPDVLDGATSSDGAKAMSFNAESAPPEVEGRNSVNSNKGGSRRKRKHSPDEAGGMIGAVGNDSDEKEVPVDPQSDVFAVLEGSALVPFLESKLQANSFLEICSHGNVYKCVVNILREIAFTPGLAPLLGPLTDQKQSLQSLLQGLESQARVLLEKIGKAAANGSVPKSGKALEKVSDKNSDDKLAREFLNLSKEVTQILTNAPSSSMNGEVEVQEKNSDSDMVNTNGNGDFSDDNESPQQGSSGLSMSLAKNAKEKAAELYKNYMKPLQFDSCDFSLQGSQAHAFASQFQKAGSPSSQVIIRVAQEVSSLSSSLPLDFSSSIFVRTDDDRATLLKAIITGPEDTPYTGGCYQFDIFFPSKYPHAPPQVNFRTTGGGLVRFNPNLYNCGKVCLSLLGTWEGAQGEQWNETSTILQVLISIQSLILCSEPYYNEPGFERLYGTPQGDQDSLRYSEDVLKNNLRYAILGQLQNPPEGFEDIIRAHFYLKRETLLQELESMLDKYKSKDVRKQFAEVQKELIKLEPPPNLKSFQKNI